MAKKAKQRFRFGLPDDLALGASGDDVRALQSILATFGYLPGSYQPGQFDDPTQRAVRRYQRFYKLATDGVVGPQTKTHMYQPRCGVTDRPRVPVGATGAAFVLRGCSYARQDLTYAFLNTTADLTAVRQRQIMREAFETWAQVANLRFTEVGVSDNPDFPIAWHRHSHGDGSPFDESGGPDGNTLAHAFFPPPCGGPNAGAMHFDDAEVWVDDLETDGIRLRQVAIHEIGHLLGLSHSDDQAAIMFALYDPDRIALAPDDVAGIQTIYGVPVDARELVVGSTVSGALPATGAEDLYTLRAPGPVAIVLDGPGDADFDLYVRRNQAPTVTEFDFRAFTVAADEQLVLPPTGGETYFVMTRSFRGDGTYSLQALPLAA